MRKIFNYFSKIYQSLTRRLHREVSKYPVIFPSTKQAPFENTFPSLEKVRRLIRKGAKVNALIDHETALSICAMKYAYSINMLRSASGVHVTGGFKITHEDWQRRADRYLAVAKLLVEAGADPRCSEKSGLNVQPEIADKAKEFKDLLLAAEAAAVKRDINKTKPPKNSF